MLFLTVFFFYFTCPEFGPLVLTNSVNIFPISVHCLFIYQQITYKIVFYFLKITVDYKLTIFFVLPSGFEHYSVKMRLGNHFLLQI